LTAEQVESIIEVFDSKGQLIQSSTVNINEGNNNTTINLEQVANGAYFARLRVGNQSTTTQFIVSK